MSATAISPARRGSARWVAPVSSLALVSLIGTAAIAILSDEARIEQAILFIQSPYGLLGLFALSALSTATLILPVPGLLLTAAAATVADPLLVGLLAGLGQTIGELTGYLAGASGDSLTGDRLSSSRIAGWMRRAGPLALFVLAVIPNPVFDVAGIVAGALRMPIWQYLLATGSGKVIRNVAIAWAAAQGIGLLTG